MGGGNNNMPAASQNADMDYGQEGIRQADQQQEEQLIGGYDEYRPQR